MIDDTTPTVKQKTSPDDVVALATFLVATVYPDSYFSLIYFHSIVDFHPSPFRQSWKQRHQQQQQQRRRKNTNKKKIIRIPK